MAHITQKIESGWLKMNKSRSEMQKIGEEVNLSTYHMLQTKGAGNEIADIISKIEIMNGLVEENFIDIEIYKNYVEGQKVEIKNLVAKMYANMKLDEVECLFDKVFEGK